MKTTFTEQEKIAAKKEYEKILEAHRKKEVEAGDHIPFSNKVREGLNELVFVFTGRNVVSAVGSHPASFLYRKLVPAKIYVKGKVYEGIFNTDDHSLEYVLKDGEKSYYFRQFDFTGGFEFWKDYKIEYVSFSFSCVWDNYELFRARNSLNSAML